MRVSLSSLPAYSQTRVVDFPRLDGGLNIRELSWKLPASQSPNMKNLWWHDGLLQCRDGQRLLCESPGGTGWAAAEGCFHGFAVLHIGARLYALRPEAEAPALLPLLRDVPENPGTFFRYDGALFYKNRGGFYRLDYDAASDSLRGRSVAEEGYVPVILINADPETGGGDLYQPENRLSSRKTVRFNAKEGVKNYRLPVTGVDAVTAVAVDGTPMLEGADYTVNLSGGEVIFTEAPPVTDPPTENTVEITYAKANAAAYSAVMDCNRAFTGGEGGSLCIVLAGCPAQPNAVFWNSNDSYAMNAAYFPVEYYNLCGEAGDPVTGFGAQYGETVCFKERSLGKLGFAVETVEGRDSILFTYKEVNARVGCDLPETIRLVENNLVFCSTRRGVCVLKSATPALENNVGFLSGDVDGTGARGLLHDLGSGGTVCGFDDRRRYWVCANGHAWVWPYAEVDKPAWFYQTDIAPAGFFLSDGGGLFHLNAAGAVTAFDRGFSDYGEAIDKVLTLSTQFFGGYERRKDVLSLLVAVRSDTDTVIGLRYDTDFERRVDLTPIRSWSWRLTPRNLARRCLASARFGHVERRDPKCRGVRHFSLTLANNTAGEDLAVSSLRIYYRLQERER